MQLRCLVPAGLLGLLCLVSACSRARSINDFSTETRAERVGTIDPRSFGQAYAGGKMTRVAIDAEGFLYVATSGPCQLLRIAPNGELHWAQDGAGSHGAPFQGPLVNLSPHVDGTLFTDGIGKRLYDFGGAGDLRHEVALSEIFDAAVSPRGEIFVYPNTKGFLLDVLDPSFRYVRSIVPLPGTPDQIATSACHLLPESDGGVLALWNPTRRLYSFGPKGERRGELTIDPPDLVTNLERRLRATQEAARLRGFSGTVNPFLDLVWDPQGRLAVLYLFERWPEAAQGGSEEVSVGSFDGAIYRFTRDGRAVDVIRGLGSIRSAAFGSGGELFGLDPIENSIIRYRLSPRA